jgi:serine phosphatase RsbU (regulator of sigma subunit)
VLQAVVNAVRKFVGDRPQSDDLTIFVVKRQRAETG